MWDKLEIFYHVAKVGNFTKAAEMLNKTQPALSRSIAVLEGRIGHRLFHRKAKGLVLTRKGEEVFRTAQRMVMEFSALKTNLDEKTGMAGKLRISTASSLASQVLSPHCINFSQQNPDIRFEVICNDHLIDIIQNEVDVAIRPYDSDDRSLVQVHLFTMTAGLYASKEYLSKFGTPQKAEDLDSHRLMIFPRPQMTPYADVEWSLKVGSTEKRKPFYAAGSVECLLAAAQEGLGMITSYEEMEGLKKSNLVRVLPDLDGPTYEYYYTYLKHLEGVEKIEIFQDFLLEAFKHMRPSKI